MNQISQINNLKQTINKLAQKYHILNLLKFIPYFVQYLNLINSSYFQQLEQQLEINQTNYYFFPDFFFQIYLPVKGILLKQVSIQNNLMYNSQYQNAIAKNF
ncbi:hypothetical protein ABPG72_004493 [Tetrahymena utriculariae]